VQKALLSEVSLNGDNEGMYLRSHGKRSGGVEYESWSLVKSVRTERGPRQRIVATLGKLVGLDGEERVGWEEVGRLLDGKGRQERGLFERQQAAVPEWATVKVRELRVERLRSFGDVYLGLSLWKRLGLDTFCAEHLEHGKEMVPWSVLAAVLTLARFCSPSSELKIAEHWYGQTALDELLGIPADRINDDRLYRALDALLPHKDALCRHLQQRYGELFGTKFDFVLYDITSSYFEGGGKRNVQAKRGYSRDGRPDCVQVCIGLVTSLEGLPLSFEVFDGNRTDVTTVEEIVETLERKYGVARRVWVMDRGMVSEDNIESLSRRHALYLVGTPRSMLKQFERELLEQSWETVQPGVEVKLARREGNAETFVLCRSHGRQAKERAMLDRFITRLASGLSKLKEQVERGKLQSRQVIERRIGRLLERNSRAASLFTVTVGDDGGRPELTVTRNEAKYEWAHLISGSYLLRTNWAGQDPKVLWQTYMQLTEVEDAFRTCKSDLGMRPIYHQRADRTQAHILVCFLSLALWRTLQHWMQGCGLGTAPRKLLEALKEVKSLDVLLPTRDKTIRLRVVARPTKELQVLLQYLKLPLPNQPRLIANVVQKMPL